MNFCVSKSTVGWRVKRWWSDLRRVLHSRVLDFAIDHHPEVRGSNLVRFAENELRRAGHFDADGFYGDMLGRATLRLIKIFSIEGHSGMSAGIAKSLASNLMMFRPLTPLTGEESEWMEITTNLFQNKRFSGIFKQDGQAYWIDGKVFREPSGCCFTSRESRVPVVFPWSYTDPVIVDVPEQSDDR